MMSFKEIPLKLLESDEMLRPVTQIAVKKEKERLKALEGVQNEVASNSTIGSEKSNVITNGANMPLNYSTASRNSSASTSSSDEDDDDHDDHHITFVSG
jgi:hypothetical protein